MLSVALATEDSLSEDVGRRLVAEMGTNFCVGLTFRKGGNGYLQKRISIFCNIANRNPLLLITDLDRTLCAPSLKDEWMGDRKHPDKMLFRVAVREIEAWLLADHAGMKKLLGNGATKLPLNPDSLDDPKLALLRFARRAPRDVRSDLLPAAGAIASQGLGYNQRLGDFVHNTWNPVIAASRSDSLRRTRLRLRELAARERNEQA